MNKKFISFCLVLMLMTLTVSTNFNVQAQTKSDNQSIQIIQALGVMNTDKSKSNNLSSNITRAEYAQMLVNMSVNKDTVSGDTNVSLYKDVSKNYWAAGYIKHAISNQWMSGYMNGTFKPEEYITLQEAVNGVVQLLGYTNSDFTGNKNSAKMQLYKSTDLDKNISSKAKDKLTRKDCMNLFYNTLVAKNKAGLVYATTLGYSLDSKGEIHYLELVNSNMEGPIIATIDWTSKIPFSTTNASYYRNGVKSNLNSVQVFDVLYYHKELHTIWAYSDKVTGTLKAISPDKKSPTAITLAGEVYNLEGQDMSYEFSTLGDTKIGDVITILLGQEGTVVEVLNDTEYSTTVKGVILETGEKLMEDVNGILYNSAYAIIVDSYGHRLEVEYKGDEDDYVKEQVVIVSYGSDGITITPDYQRFQNPISGTVDEGVNRLGAYPFANDVRIVDVNNSEYITIPKSRLAGASLLPSDILLYSMNPNGEIEAMILNDVTGDMNQYGVITSVDYAAMGTQVQTTYTALIDGVVSTFSPDSSTDASVDTGAARFIMKDNKISEVNNLTGVYITSIDGIKVNNYGQTYLLADEVAVYYVKDSKYQSVKLSNVNNLNKYSLQAYYDAATLSGGRIRVIIAREK